MTDVRDLLSDSSKVRKRRASLDSEMNGIEEMEIADNTHEAFIFDPTDHDIDYLLWTEKSELETGDKFLYVEVNQSADIIKIKDRRREIASSIKSMDNILGKKHTVEFQSAIQAFDTVNSQAISEEFVTRCEGPTAWTVELLYEKKQEYDTFKLTVQLRRNDTKTVPTKVDLTVSINSDDGVEMAFINFESLICSEDDSVSSVTMATEALVKHLPEKALYKIILKVSGCCGPSYVCPEVWITSKIPQINSRCRELQDHLSFGKRIKYFSDVELGCGIETLLVNKFMLHSREWLLKLISDPKKEACGNRVQLNERCCSMPEVMNEFLKFLYTGACEDLSSKNAQQLYFLARDYGLKGLQLICKMALIDNITVSNFFATFLFSRHCGEEGLRKALLSYAGKHKEEIQEILQSHKYLHYDKELCEAVGETYVPREEVAKDFTPEESLKDILYRG